MKEDKNIQLLQNVELQKQKLMMKPDDIQMICKEFRMTEIVIIIFFISIKQKMCAAL